MSKLPIYIKFPLIAVLVLVVLCEVAWLFFLKTSVGKSIIAAQVETQLENVLGGSATIGSLEGALPNYIIVRDLSVDDDNNPSTPDIISVEYLYLHWSPFSLLSRDININELIIKKAQLDHFPQSKDEDQEGASAGVPVNLPDVYIGSLHINDFGIGEAIAGRPIQIDAEGSGRLKDENIKLDLNVLTDNGNDVVRILAEIEPRSNKFVVDGLIRSDVNGLITKLAGSEGPVRLEFKGDNDSAEARLGVDAILGKFGAVDLVINTPLSGNEFSVSGNVTLGEKLANIADLFGNVVDVNVEGVREKNGVALTLNNVSSEAAALEGNINWADNDDILKTVVADVRVKSLTDYFSQFGVVRNDVISLDAELSDQNDNSYDVSFNVASSNFQITSENSTTDLAQMFNGDVGVLWGDKAYDLPLFQKAGSVKANILLNLEQNLTIKNLAADLGAGLSASGGAGFDLNSNALNANFDIRATPSFVALFTNDVVLDEDISGTIQLDGTQDKFGLKFSGDLPTVMYTDSAIPASDISIDLAGLPSHPTGRLLAQAKDGEGLLDVTVESGAQAYDISNILYKAENFHLEGAAKLSLQSEYLNVDLTYQGDAGAQPYPGIVLVGGLDIRGDLGSEQDTSLAITSNQFAMNDLHITGLDTRVLGDFSEVTINSKLSRLMSGSTQLLENLVTQLVVTTDDQAQITVNNFATVLPGQGEVKTLSPAVISVVDGIAIDDLALLLGEAGRVNVSGAFRGDRWLADIRAENVSSLESDTAVSFNLDIDTSRNQLGIGAFDIHPALEQSNAPLTIAGAIDWSDDTLKVTNSNDTDAVTFDFVVPAKLIRSDSLAISTEGPLTGSLSYAGAIEKLLSLLPVHMPALEGQLDADIKVGGSVSAPAVNGNIQFSDGAFTDDATGFSLVGLHAKVTAENSGSPASRILFTGGGRGPKQEDADRVSVEGAVELGALSKIDMEILLDGLDISAEPVENLISNGSIKISGPLDAISVVGAIDIDEMNVEIITPPQTGLVDINVIEVSNDDDVPISAPTPSSTVSTTVYDLTINAEDRIFIRGRGLESEWETALRVITDADTPLVLGTADLKRGSFDFSGRRFDLTEGKVEFDRLSPNDPVISLIASYETSNGTVAIVSASGRGSNPEVELTSTPTLPSSDVMALVLFGKPSEDLTAIESLQTAQALASLGGIGPFAKGGIAGSLRQTTGLDLVNIDLDPETGASALTVGKYLAEGLFVSATQDVKAQNGAVNVEYELTDNITVESNIRQDGDQTVSVNWKKDF